MRPVSARHRGWGGHERRAVACAGLLAALLGGPHQRAGATSWGLFCPHPGLGVPASTRGEVLLGAWSTLVKTALAERGYTSPEPVEGASEPCNDFQQAVVEFDRPRDEVLALLTQTHRQAEFLPSLSKVESVERSEGHSVDRHQMKILFTRLDYHVRNEWSFEDSMMWWSLDPERESDIVALDGYWHLFTLAGDRTLAIYASRVNVGSLIPKSVQRRLGKQKLSQSLDSFRQWVNSNGSYRP